MSDTTNSSTSDKTLPTADSEAPQENTTVPDLDSWRAISSGAIPGDLAAPASIHATDADCAAPSPPTTDEPLDRIRGNLAALLALNTLCRLSSFSNVELIREIRVRLAEARDVSREAFAAGSAPASPATANPKRAK